MPKAVFNLAILALVALATFAVIGAVTETGGIRLPSVRPVANAQVDYQLWIIPGLAGFVLGFIWRTVLWDLPVIALGWCQGHKKEFGYLVLLFGLGAWVVYS